MKILIVGDSVCHNNGFTDPTGKLWLDQFASNHDIVNPSIGASGNQKIVTKITKALVEQEFDFAIIVWSSIFRLNFNRNDSIYDGNEACGSWGYTTPKLKKVYETYVSQFSHFRVEITEFLCYIILAIKILKDKKVPFLFIKNFENFVSDLQIEHWQNCSDYYLDTVLFRKDLPDWEIEKFHLEMRNLYLEVEKLSGPRWINLYETAWMSTKFIDYAEDGCHPGVETCKKFGQDVIEFAKTLGITL